MRKINMIALAATLAMPACPPASAQTPAPAIPEALPWDVPYGTPISLDDANKAIAASIAEAKKHNWKMSISVVDPAGNLLAHATMDSTQIGSIAISQAKARTAVQFRRPSKVLQDAVNGVNGAPPVPSLLTLLGPAGAAASEGGWPIIKDGKIIGGIGASGGLGTQDGVTAKAAFPALGLSMP